MKGNKDLVFDYYFKHPMHKNLTLEQINYINQMERERKMKIKVEESIKLEDGKHSGEIDDVEYRDTPYDYTDIVLKTEQDGKELKIKAGYATKITANSALGQLIERFGAKLEIGKDLEVEEFLTKGKKVTFQSITKKSSKGEFFNVIPESLKPE